MNSHSVLVHPLSLSFRDMTEEEYTQLVEDIAINGLHEPIMMYDGQILDGRHRHRALNDLHERGIVPAVPDPAFTEFDGTYEEAEAYVESMNNCRRHLTQTMKACRAVRWAREQPGLDRAAGRPKKNGTTVVPFSGGRTREVAAVRHGVSSTLVQQAAEVEAEAPELFEQMLDGRIGIREALQEAKRETKAHVSYNSGDNEWYTPKEYIEAARQVMGGIDLDPASTPAANSVVGATQFYTAEDDGLTRRWEGKVWMNPPYSTSLIGRFCERLVTAVNENEVTEACVLVNNATETAWFQSLVEVASAICFPRGRVRFWAVDKESAPLQGQAVIYIGKNFKTFRDVFYSFGFTVEL